MKIKTKLYLGFGTVLVLLIVLLAILANLLGQLNQNMYNVVKEQYEVVRLTQIIRYEINNQARESRGLTANPPNELKQELVQNIQQSRQNIKAAIEALDKIDFDNQSKRVIIDLKIRYEEYYGYVEQAVALENAGQSTGITEAPQRTLTQVIWYDGRQSREQIFQITNKLLDMEDQEMKAVLQHSGDTYALAVRMIYSSVLVALIIGIGITLWVVRSITGNLYKVSSVITSVTLNQAEQLPRIAINTQDEIADIAVAFNGMAEILEEQAKQEKILKQVAQQESWLKAGVAEVTSIYPEAQDLKSLADIFTTKVTPMVGASYSVFYFHDPQANQPQLLKLSAYADNHQDIGTAGFHIGEGLIGQCALENKAILLNQVPDSYIKITSGLGRSTPASIMIMPVEFEGRVLAVIEMASFEKFSPLQQSLLQKVLCNLGTTLNNMINHLKVERLLEESQTLTEELQTQSEELQQQQEELRTINEKLEEQYEHSEQKADELNKTKRILEEKAHQVELSSKYKSEFLANMSHELRTPLNSLLILAQMLAENHEKNLTTKQIEYAYTIYTAGDDLLRLINEILDLAKVESGKMQIVPRETELDESITFIKEQFQPVALRKDLNFLIKLDADLPKIIYVDNQLLQQIIKNLLSNAFKFTEKGSVLLHIRKADQIDISKLPLDKNVATVLAIAVTDTGIGIPKEKQEIIFKAFLQADGTTSRKYGGTGLGLTICKEMAALLGGYIGVESADGQGSTFTLYLPLSNVQHQPKVLAPEQEAAGIIEEVSALPPLQQGEEPLEGKKVLIVDDDMRNIFALTTALEQYKLEVLFAENGREGLKVLTENPDINLVLMDIMMPEMDGYETMQYIRQLPQYRTLPIIALTAKAMKNDRSLCIEAGASDYISKPVNLEQLCSLMRVWLYKSDTTR